MEIENKPRRKKIFDKEDPHFSGTLLVLALVTAALLTSFGSYHYDPSQTIALGMAAITFVYLIISMNYPQKPRWFWYLGLLAGWIIVGTVGVLVFSMRGFFLSI